MVFGLLSQHSGRLAAWLEPAVPIGLGSYSDRREVTIGFLLLPPPPPFLFFYLQDLGFSLLNFLGVLYPKI